MLWYSGRTDLGVLHFIANVAVSKSRHWIFFYPKGKAEKNRKDFWDYFLSSWDRLWKGKVLSSFASIVIYGLLLLSRSLVFVWKCALCGFLKYFVKKPLSRKTFVMILVCKNVYKVLSFWKCFEVWKMVLNFFLKVLVFVLKISKDVCFESEKATRNNLPTQMSFLYIFIPLTLLIYHCFGK